MNITRNAKKDQLTDKLILASFPTSILTLLISIAYPPLSYLNIISFLIPLILTCTRIANYNTRKLKKDIFYVDFIRYDKDFDLEKIKELTKELELSNKRHNKLPNLKYEISVISSVITSILGIALTNNLLFVNLFVFFILTLLIETEVISKSLFNYQEAKERLNLIITEFENIEKEKVEEYEKDSKETPKVITNTKTITQDIIYEDEIKPKTKVLKK